MFAAPPQIGQDYRSKMHTAAAIKSRRELCARRLALRFKCARHPSLRSEPQRQPCAPPSSGSPEHTATSCPASVQPASLATDCNCRRPGPCLSCDSRSCAPACDRASAHQPPRRTSSSSSARHFVSAGTAVAACSPSLTRAKAAAWRTSALWFPDHTATSNPTPVQSADLVARLQLSHAGSVFELRFPQLCSCLRSCQCPPTTAAHVPKNVR